jgi:hypothetical protein
MSNDSGVRVLMCPSAQPEMDGSEIFGLVLGSDKLPQVAYLQEYVNPNHEILATAEAVHPTEVFRFAAPCAREQCRHFFGERCRLANRVVQILPAVTDALPPCRLRSECVWWRQEGVAACVRCPQIVTRMYGAGDEQQRAAGMAVEGGSV